jgi:hypothetical protein
MRKLVFVAFILVLFASLTGCDGNGLTGGSGFSFMDDTYSITADGFSVHDEMFNEEIALTDGGDGFVIIHDFTDYGPTLDEAIESYKAGWIVEDLAEITQEMSTEVGGFDAYQMYIQEFAGGEMTDEGIVTLVDTGDHIIKIVATYDCTEPISEDQMTTLETISNSFVKN